MTSPRGGVEGGEERGGAVAFVVASLAGRGSRTQRKHWLGAVERLSLRLLIHAEHHRPLRRVHVQADDVAHLLNERGSAESLKVSTRCGCRPKARHIRLTGAELMPHAFAIERVLHCVASRCIVSSVIVTTRSTSASLTLRGVPGLGSLSRPSYLFSMNRRSHLPNHLARGAQPGRYAHVALSLGRCRRSAPASQRSARSWAATASVPALPVVHRRSPALF